MVLIRIKRFQNTATKLFLSPKMQWISVIQLIHFRPPGEDPLSRTVHGRTQKDFGGHTSGHFHTTVCTKPISVKFLSTI